MKTKVQFFLAGGALAFLILGSSVSFGESTMPNLAKFQNTSQIMVDKCMACHSKDYDLPFYAAIPGIKSIIEKDYRDGLRAMDITQEFMVATQGQPINEAALAKMEWVILNGTMPPMKFAMVHWGSSLNDEEKKLILDWVKESRAAHYATGTAAPEFANEPIQPIPFTIPYDAEKAKIGQQLFDDKRLSADSTLACSGCHALEKAGTDQLRFSEGIMAQFGDINAPTTYNAVFNTAQFWDGRAADLAEQAAGPPLNPIEMGSKSWEEIIARLSGDKELTAAFTAIYPTGWSGENITDALAEHEKTLITPNSRFDKWLMGDKGALTANEIKGYNLFKTYRCSSCHVGKSVGGQSFEYMDLKADYFAKKDRKPLNSDKGRMTFTKNPDDLHRFKVPNLRNIEYTWPYLHDGSVNTLDETVEIMGTYLSGMSVTEQDRKLIVEFMRSLSGELNGKPIDAKIASK